MAKLSAEMSEQVLTSSGLQAYCVGVRADDMTQYDALHEAAARLRKGIEKSGGSWWKGGLGAKWHARRISRPLEHAADLHMEAAKAAGVCWALFCGSVEGAQGAKAGAFDPTK